MTEYQQVLNRRPVTFEESRQLSYTQALIDESLRMYPIAHAINRTCVNEDIVNGYRIPAGANSVLAIYHVHHNSGYWNDPERFQPERFLENQKPSHSFAYIPFGTGPRQCIGNDFAKLEMQLIVSAIVQRFRFELEPNFRPEPSVEATYQLKRLPIKIMGR